MGGAAVNRAALAAKQEKAEANRKAALAEKAKKAEKSEGKAEAKA